MFTEVKLRWGDADYVIAPERRLGAIAIVEEIITLDELSRYMKKDAAPRAHLARGFGALLRYAGARVTDDEIYFGMFGTEAVVRVERVMTATAALLSLMIPPNVTGEVTGEVNPPQEAPSG